MTRGDTGSVQRSRNGDDDGSVGHHDAARGMAGTRVRLSSHSEGLRIDYFTGPSIEISYESLISCALGSASDLSESSKAELVAMPTLGRP